MSQAPPPDFSAVITAIRNSGAAVSGAITQNTAILRNLQQNISQIGQPAAPPPETAAQKAARLLREAEERKQAAIQRRRAMLKRVGAGALKYSGANAVGRGLRNIGRRITRAASSVFTWGTVITAALAYFVNSPFWNDFKELLADSTKEGGWLNTFIKSVKEFFQPLEGIGKDLLKGEFGKATDKLADFFISLMNRLIDKINKVMPLDMLKISPFKTTGEKKRDAEAIEQANKLNDKRIADQGGKGFVEKVEDATKTALNKTPAFVPIAGVGPSVADVGDFIGGDLFDRINSSIRDITGTLLTLETMSDKQLSDRQKELANMTNEDYVESGASRLQVEPGSLGETREEALAKFIEETKRRMAARERGGTDAKETVPSDKSKAEIPKNNPILGRNDPRGQTQGGTVPGGLQQAGANANSSNVRPVVPPPAPPVTTPVPRGPEANVQPNVQPPAPSTTVVSPKNMRPNGMVPLLTGQAYP